MEFENFMGIDLSKDTLDYAGVNIDGELLESKGANDRQSIEKEFLNFSRDFGIDLNKTLICAEFTGHFGNKLIDVALKLGLNLWMESAYKIIHSQGLIRGKSDSIDALRIMEYAKRFQDKAVLLKPSSSNIQLLKRLSTERDLVVKDIAKYKSQLKQEEGFFDKKYFSQKTKRIQKVKKINEKVLSELEEEIDRILDSDPEINKNFERILAIEGVGKQTAVATIVATENFSRFKTARKFSCHIGCAPFSYQSGTSLRTKGKVSHKANKNIKRLYHMAAVSTIRTKGELSTYYQRKVDEGKHKMSVINAIRAKLIARVFAVVNQDRDYEKKYIHSLA